MFQRILVPLDGSRLAERVLPLAAHLAQSSNGTLILVRVVNPLWPTTNQTMFAQQLPYSAKFEAERYLLNLSKSAAMRNVATKIIVPLGTEGSTILTTAEQEQADIIVLSTHGYISISRWMLGNVAEKVSNNAAVPVLLVRAEGSIPLQHHSDPLQPMRILVPLDGSALALAAIEEAAELVLGLNASLNSELHLTYVVDDMQKLQAARDYLQSIRRRIKQGELAPVIAHQQLPITWSITINSNVADGIIRVAENGEDVENSGVFGGCDIIAMSTHGQTDFPFWSLGSVTEQVRTNTRLPMLIIRPPAIAEQLHKLYAVEPELVRHMH